MIKTTLVSLFKFFKNPDDQQIDISIRDKIYFTIILLVFKIIISSVFIFPILTKIDEIIELKYTDDDDFPFLQMVLFGAILVPFFEELFFRYFLRYNGLKTKIISVKRWRKIFPFLVYFSIICFGLMHITNYSNNSNLFYILSPLIVLSQLFGGLIITFLRVRLNFFWGVLYHCIWNFLVIIEFV